MEDDFDIKSLLEDDDDEFQMKSLQEEINSPDVKVILDALEADEEFNAELESILTAITEESLDLSQLQSSMILLIQAALEKMGGRDKEKIKAILRKKENQITEHINKASLLILHHKSTAVQAATRGIDTPKDKYSNLTVSARANLQQVMRRLAIYEIYKIMNPHQIAGETKRENFIHNVIASGLKQAMKYEGASEAKSFTPRALKSLEKQHNRFKSGGGKGMMM